MRRLLRPDESVFRRLLYIAHKQNLYYFWWNRLYCALRECYGYYRCSPLDADMHRRFALLAYTVFDNKWAREDVYDYWKNDEYAKASRRRKLRKRRGLPV